MTMKTNSKTTDKANCKPKKKYRDMDNDEKYDYNCSRIWDVVFIGVPLLFLVRYILLGFAIDHLGYTLNDVYPVWWCFKWIAGIIMTSLIIYFDVRTPRSGWPGRTFGG